jgi:hypothetical protein
MATKRWGVNVTRTITLEQTIYVNARNESSAMDKVQNSFDNGKAGNPYVTYAGSKDFWVEPELCDINEEISVDDAHEADPED